MTPAKPRVFNVFYGEEGYLLDRELRGAVKWPDRHVHLLDGADTTEDAIVEAMGDLPLDENSGTIVVVDNAEEVKVSSGLIAYARRRNPKDRSSLLVAICRTAQLSKGWSEVAASGRAVEYARFKPWEKEKIKDRLLSEVELLGLTLEEGAFDLLFTLHGEQTSCMVNELRKATYLVENGAAISRDTVLSICARRYSVAPWDVAEAAFAKDSKRALRAVSMLFQDRGEETLVPVVASMMKQLERLVVLRNLLDQQQTPEAMGAALGIHPFRVKKDLPTVRKHTVPQLLEQMKNLCELEAQIKGAAPAKRTLVELAVLSLAA